MAKGSVQKGKMRWLGRGHWQSVHCETAGCNMSVKWPERPRSRAMRMSFMGGAAEWSVRQIVWNRSKPCNDMCPKEWPMKGGSGHPRTDRETLYTGRSGMAIKVMMLIRATLHFDH